MLSKKAQELKGRVLKEFVFPFDLHEYQWETAARVSHQEGALIRDPVGCVDADTEFLTPDRGWVRIADYIDGMEVAEVSDSVKLKVKFTPPLAYIKEKATQAFRFKTKYGVDQVLSPEHTMLISRGIQPNPNMVRVPAGPLAESIMKWGEGGESKILINENKLDILHISTPCTFQIAADRMGLPFTDEQLRLMIAIIADGYYAAKNNPNSICVIRIKKDRKKERIRRLLSEAKIPWTEITKDFKTAKGFTVFRFKPGFYRKKFPMSWVSLISNRQCEIFCDEVLYWDGCQGEVAKGRRTFHSRIRESADFVQFVCASQGYKAALGTHKRLRSRGEGGVKEEVDYVVSISQKQVQSTALTGLGVVDASLGRRQRHTNVEPFILEDGFKYCFTVPSGLLILRRNGKVFITGNCGKTVISLAAGLNHSIKSGVEQILILAPPVLLYQWAEFIEQVKGIDGYLMFRGSPAERKKMDLESAPIVLMSYNIFRSDFPRVEKLGKKRKLFIIADELSLKSSNQTFKKFKTLIYRKLRLDVYADKPQHLFCALNATPVSDRGQVYWWSSIFNPQAYPSLRLFTIQHVLKEDHWGKPLEWMNIPILENNFDKFSVLSRDVELELPESVFTEIPYKLEPAHLKLYQNIMEAEFEGMPDEVVERMIDAMFSTLQRVVLCPSDYGLDIRPPILDVIDQRLDQMDEDDRVIIYTRHVSVSKMLCNHYPQAVAVFGGVSDKNKKENLRRFKAGEAEIMIANLDSLSRGMNLQVANHTIFTELPFRSDMMTQACGRTARQGQKKTCFFHVPLAKGTIQSQIYRNLLNNDRDLKNFNRNKKTLREFLLEK